MGFLSVIVMFVALIVVLIIASFVLLVNIILYILESIAIYSFAKTHGNTKPWLAWIPYARSYLKGHIADIASGKGHFRYTLPICKVPWLFLFVLAFGDTFPADAAIEGNVTLFVVSAISIFIVNFVMEAIVAYHMFNYYHPLKATTLTILSAIPGTSFLRRIFLFTIRKRQPAYTPVECYANCGNIWS